MPRPSAARSDAEAERAPDPRASAPAEAEAAASPPRPPRDQGGPPRDEGRRRQGRGRAAPGRGFETQKARRVADAEAARLAEVARQNKAAERRDRMGEVKAKIKSASKVEIGKSDASACRRCSA